MNNKIFTKILNERILKIQFTLSKKAEEYASDQDCLYNFKRAAEINQTNAADSLWGIATKHLVSIMDLVKETNCLTENVNVYLNRIDEKIGDLINYLILLEAILKENFIND